MGYKLLFTQHTMKNLYLALSVLLFVLFTAGHADDDVTNIQDIQEASFMRESSPVELWSQAARHKRIASYHKKRIAAARRFAASIKRHAKLFGFHCKRIAAWMKCMRNKKCRAKYRKKCMRNKKCRAFFPQETSCAEEAPCGSHQMAQEAHCCVEEAPCCSHQMHEEQEVQGCVAQETQATHCQMEEGACSLACKVQKEQEVLGPSHC